MIVLTVTSWMTDRRLGGFSCFALVDCTFYFTSFWCPRVVCSFLVQYFLTRSLVSPGHPRKYPLSIADNHDWMGGYPTAQWDICMVVNQN